MTGALRFLIAAAGLLTGAAVVAIGLYLWPFAFENRLSAAEGGGPAGARTESFFLNITGDNVLATHGGAFPFRPFPDGIGALGGGHTPNTFALATRFRDAPAGEVVAFGTELEIAHPGSSLLRGKIMTHTLWSIVVPGRGVLHLYQIENNWRLFKKVVLPMRITGRAFEGEFRGVNTLGPLDGFRGLVLGGTGEFTGASGSFVEIGTLKRLTPNGGMGGVMELRVHYRTAPPG